MERREGRIYRGTVETTTAVYGQLYEIDGDGDDGDGGGDGDGDGDDDGGGDGGSRREKPVIDGFVLVGFVQTRKTENFFGERFEMDEDA